MLRMWKGTKMDKSDVFGHRMSCYNSPRTIPCSGELSEVINEAFQICISLSMQLSGFDWPSLHESVKCGAFVTQNFCTWWIPLGTSSINPNRRNARPLPAQSRPLRFLIVAYIVLCSALELLNIFPCKIEVVIYSNMTSTDKPVPTGLPNTDLFTLESIPSKGKGLIAAKAIPAGTLLISEPPLFTTASLTNADTIEKDLGAIIKGLPKEGQRAFLTLHNNFPGQPNPFSNIIRSNGYPLGPSSEVGGVFPLIARLNHSCRPNAQHAWNDKLQEQTVYAVRDIAAGEELTLSYHNGGPSAERKAALRQFFGFDCACELCGLPAEKLKKSDKRLRDAAKLDEMIGDSERVQLEPADALKDCKELLKIYNVERITDNRLARLYYDAFQICALHSDGARASVFAESTRRARELCEGPDSEEAANMKGFETEPEKFENWGSTKNWASKVADRETKYKGVQCPVTVKTAAIWDA